jgi:hypothetical protein
MNNLPCAVSGTVRDARGAIIPNATVRVIETANGTIHTFTADGGGRYCASGLPEGKYSVTFERSGFRATRIDAVTIAVDRSTLADVKLPSSGNQPAVESPKGAAPPISAPSIASPVAPFEGPTPGHGGAPPPPAPVAPTPVAPSSDPAAALGIAEAKWFAQLHKGSILYDVPPAMTIGKPSTVTVTINGYKAPPPQQSGADAPATLKVSEWMRVEVTQPDNPDEFTIAGDPSQNPQFVPIDAGATWTWTVTPNHLGKDQKLQFQAFVLYQNDTSKVQRALPSAEKIVTVQAEGITGIASQIDDNFWTNPLNWFKYMLPGGAGFAALIGLITWWLKSRKKGGSESPAKPGDSGKP